MLETKTRKMTDDERSVLEQLRANRVGTLRNFLEWRTTLLAYLLSVLAAGVVAVLYGWHPGIGLLAVIPIVAGLIDLHRARKAFTEKTEAADHEWGPMFDQGKVEVVTGTSTAGIRIDDNEANTAWFLQVGDAKILVVWHLADEATENVKVVRVPNSLHTLSVAWSGDRLQPLRPKRLFKRGEKELEQCAVLDGRLEELDAILKPTKSAETGISPGGDKLVAKLTQMGFFKFVDDLDDGEWNSLVKEGWYELFLAAGRLFNGDAERLAEGGVGDVIDYMRSALAHEGVSLGEVVQHHDQVKGYRLEIGGAEYVMWSAKESNSTWALTVDRTAILVNRLLTEAGSGERLFLIGSGEDSNFLLMTHEMKGVLEKSRVFTKSWVPALLK